MKIQMNGLFVRVQLSEKNLNDLLGMLKERGKTEGLAKRMDNGVLLQVQPQTDEDHYQGGPIGRGWERRN